jgi:hypothetical protein
MPLEFYPTAPDDLSSVSALMLAGFNAGPEAPFVDQTLLNWKYFEPGPSWSGSRGYVLKNGDAILAHCGIWPINLSLADRNVTCNLFVDWVSDKSLPGAGFLLKRKLMTMTDTALVVGGTDNTRAVVPRLGFHSIGDVGYFVKIVRPWRQFRTRPSEGIGRDAARLMRNAAWSVAMGPTSTPKDWSAVPLPSFDGVTLEINSYSEHPTPWRSTAYLNYWLRSPTAKVSGFAIHKQNKPRGYFLLSQVGGQTRIADIRLSSTKQDEWNAAYALAAHAAGENPETCEIIAAASTTFSEIALQSSGFRQRGGAPMFLFDPQKKLADSPSIFWNMIDADAAYLHDPDHPYTT